MLKATKSSRENRAVWLPAGRPLSASLLALVLTAAGVASAQPRATAAGPAPAVATASGQPPLIAMMPFDGKDTPTPPKRPLNPVITAAAVGDTLAGRTQARYYKVLGPDLWAGMARLKHHGRPTDIRPIARLVKASLIIGGFVEATPGQYAPKPYRLTVTLYDDQGQLLGQLGYDLDKPAVIPQQFAGQATAFFQMVDQALHLPASAATPPVPAVVASVPAYSPAAAPQTPTPPPAPVFPESAVLQVEDREAAPLDPNRPLIPASRSAREIYDRRPPWLPAFDLRVGYLFSSRAFIGQGSELRMPRTGASGAVVHGELYPFSFMKSAGAALAGLGVRFTALLPVWGDLGQTSSDGGTVSGTYRASEQRLEGAVHWSFNYWGEVLRPVIEMEALFGDHRFTLAPRENVDYLHLPSSDYQYLGGMLGLRLFVTRRIGARVGFTFAKLLSFGPLGQPGVDANGQSLLTANGFQSYGPGDGLLWRINLGLSYNVWKGITLGGGFFYEQTKLAFNGQGNILQSDGKSPVISAQDESMGIMLTVGYVYQPYLH